MRIAITGVSGFLGQRLLAQLDHIEQIERVVGISRTPPTHSSPKLSFHPMDINGPITELLAADPVDAIVHVAWVVNPSHDEEGVRRVNIDGTRNVLSACDELGIKKVIFTSSAIAYGAHPDNPLPMPEDTPLRGHPKLQHSKTVAEADPLFCQYQANHPSCCVSTVRLCMVIGPEMDNFLTRYAGRSIFYAIRGYDPPVQFVHVDDAVSVLVNLVREHRPGVYNIAGDGTVRVSELGGILGCRVVPLPHPILYMVALLGWNLRIKAVTEAPPSLFDFLKYYPVVDCTKAKRELSFQPRHTSREAAKLLGKAHRIAMRSAGQRLES